MSEEFDPFADDNGEEPEAPKEAPKKAPARKTTTRKTTVTKEKPVAENETKQSKLSITLKGGSGFDAPWVVIYPDTLDEARELLSDENRDALKEILEQTQKAAEFFVSKGSQKPAGGGGGAPRGNGGQNRGRAPQGATEHPDGKKEFCQHGEMVYKTGTIKNGKRAGSVYQAFDCPEGECDRKWAN